MLLNDKEAKAITDKVLSYVTADDAEVSVRSDKNANLRFANNALLTSGSTIELGANITVWKKSRSGSASTSDLDDASLKSMVERAEKVADISPVDRQYLPTLGKQTYKPVPGFVEATSNPELKKRAESAGRIIAESTKTGVISAGFHETSARASGFATKNGNFGFEKVTFGSLSVTARTSDGLSSGYFERGHHDINRLDTDRVAREAISKASKGRGARVVEPGVYPVILEPQAVDDLLGNLRFQFDARLAEEGRSPFSLSGGKTKVGEQVFDERIDIFSDPWDPEVPGSMSAQDGMPAEKLHLVEKGILKNLVYSRFWAKEKEKSPTPGPVNMIFRSNKGASTIEDMIANSKKALLIGRFWYIRTTDQRTASVTGLTRDGVWMVEDGKIAYPVTNFRFNQSLIQMIAAGNVDMIGAPERIGRTTMLPSLKLREFNFTSVSQAV